MRLQRAQLTLRAVWLEADLVFFPAPLPPAFRSSIRRSPNSMRRMILNRKSRPETVPHLNGRSIPMNMGKVLGGGSSINVMTWARGHKNDWDYFASEAGDPAWSYESLRRKVPASGRFSLSGNSSMGNSNCPKRPVSPHLRSNGSILCF
jgi:choline dehydrogenase-like flavoprotein